ncbi:MAG: glycosyltransferase [Prevotella sp.]|jgi:glycosyltransferase involved in cell wall biosynthesis|nr:glycosyltransferase [Prevotella sp.]MCR5152451.1 glycosyltransferase [Prevotella sp.]
MKNPKISIITISFNSEKYIEETIKSVISQNYDNLEYIIIDGGSTDSTLSIVEKYKEFISKVISEPDRGISDAFNKGILNATGNVIGIINSDDIMLPGTLNALASAYEEDVDIYRMNIQIWMSETDEKFHERPSMSFPLIDFSVHVAHQGTFVRSEAYRMYGMFDVGFRYCMDYDFLMRCYRRGAKMKYIDHDSALFRIGGATSTPFSKKRQEYMRLITKNGGSRLMSYVYVIGMSLREVAKSFLDLFGEGLKRKLRYGSRRQSS